MKPYKDSLANIFMDQMRLDWPNLSNEQSAGYAHQRDAGIAAANRLVSTAWIGKVECCKLVKSMVDGHEAVRLLTLQGLPWAFMRARRQFGKDMSKAIDMACDSAAHCAMNYNPSLGCISTLIAMDVYFKGMEDHKEQERIGLRGFEPIECVIDADRGHEERAA